MRKSSSSSPTLTSAQMVQMKKVAEMSIPNTPESKIPLPAAMPPDWAKRIEIAFRE
jgi:hypothetical protein